MLIIQGVFFCFRKGTLHQAAKKMYPSLSIAGPPQLFKGTFIGIVRHNVGLHLWFHLASKDAQVVREVRETQIEGGELVGSVCGIDLDHQHQHMGVVENSRCFLVG